MVGSVQQMLDCCTLVLDQGGHEMPRGRKAVAVQAGPLVAVGYVRVSTNEQAESGAGLTAQRSTIRSECERRGWKLAHIHADRNGASGKNLRRPALLEALEALSRGEAHVLVT